MSDYVGAAFLGSPNHAAGRRAFKYVVLHTMVGTWQAANARFQNAAQQASATYGVCLDGSVKQWVRETDTAYTNGTYFDNPGANVDSISIEHEDGGDYNGPRTPALYEASARLVADICKRHGIPIDRAHIIKHKECFQAATACPDALNVDGIVARALVLAGGPPSGIGSGADPGNLPGSGDDLTPDQATQLERVYEAIFTAPDPKNPYAGSLTQLATKKDVTAPTSPDVTAVAAAVAQLTARLDVVAGNVASILAKLDAAGKAL